MKRPYAGKERSKTRRYKTQIAESAERQLERLIIDELVGLNKRMSILKASLAKLQKRLAQVRASK